MRRSRLLLPILAICFIAGACSGGEAGARSGESPGDEVLRAALLTAGPVSDAGWYAGAYEGLLMLRDSLGAEVSHDGTAHAHSRTFSFKLLTYNVWFGGVTA